ncbi:MAG: hypothetical protein LBU72_04535 [Burkholderiaceae bacterium]|nr:hypothetical protein [Burkholderiaceae bacterium]
MLRKTVALLIALNLIWWIWAKGWLAPVGLPATFGHSPEFLARQLRPEALRVQPLPPGTPITILKTVPAAPNASAAPQAAPAAAASPARPTDVSAIPKHPGRRHDGAQRVRVPTATH